MTDKKIINGIEVDLDDPNQNRQHPKVVDMAAFKVGNFVQFKGLVVGEIRLAPRRGTLKASKNASVAGAVTLEDDPDNLIFNSNGSLYCHAQYGILLEHVRETPVNQAGQNGKKT